jgi:hypothetical protein
MGNLPSDYAALIALASADELDGIKAKILEQVEEIGMAPSRLLLVQLSARRIELADERRKLAEQWEAARVAGEDETAPEGEEGRDGW